MPEVGQPWRKQAWFSPGWTNTSLLSLLSTCQDWKRLPKLPTHGLRSGPSSGVLCQKWGTADVYITASRFHKLEWFVAKSKNVFTCCKDLKARRRCCDTLWDIAFHLFGNSVLNFFLHQLDSKAIFCVLNLCKHKHFTYDFMVYTHVLYWVTLYTCTFDLWFKHNLLYLF